MVLCMDVPGVFSPSPFSSDQSSTNTGQGSMSVSVPNLTSNRQETMSLLESFANLARRNFGCNNKQSTTASSLLRALSCNRASGNG